ncbi:hypothetical protein ACX93W_13115 [Paenibacillus sp. CAU 1782]
MSIHDKSIEETSINDTKAAINLFAVLRNLEELCRLDKTSRELLGSKRQSVNFKVRNGPSATLVFADGVCTMREDEAPGDIKLYFRSGQHFNDMIDGKGNPIPLKGFMKLGFLTKTFTELSRRLEYYLKPTPTLLLDRDYFRVHTELLLNTAAYAVACIGNNDKVGKAIAGRIPDGIIAISIEESGQRVFLRAKQGRLTAMKSSDASPSAFMIFDSIQSANDALSERVDVHELIVREKLQLKGLLPMVQNMSDLLAKVPQFL